MSHLLCLGLGYSARALAVSLKAKGWHVTGTSRAGRDGTFAFDGRTMSPDLKAAIAAATHLLVSIPPGESGDAALKVCGPTIAAGKTLGWIGYLSTIGVHGDSGGAWVDELTPPRPQQPRAIRRVEAEKAWLALGKTQVFRLAGIYGPGRNLAEDILDGTARHIVKPGQVFNRIHVDDITATLEAGIARGRPGRIYNVTDDEPAPPGDVVTHAARLLGREPPPPVPFAQANLSPMAASFYAGNRRVRNARITGELGVSLGYRTYREGLAAVVAGLTGAFAS